MSVVPVDTVFEFPSDWTATTAVRLTNAVGSVSLEMETCNFDIQVREGKPSIRLYRLMTSKMLREMAAAMIAQADKNDAEAAAWGPIEE